MFGSIAVSLLPLAGVVIVFSTIRKCYWTTAAQGRMMPGIVFPAISALGMENPEKRIYQVGFALTGLCIGLSVLVFKQLIIPVLAPLLLKVAEANINDVTTDKLNQAKEHIANQSMSCVHNGLYMAGGVMLQGIFTLEFKISAQSIVHWLSAAVFAMGAMHHCQSVVDMYSVVTADPTAPAFFQHPLFRVSLSVKKMALSTPIMMFGLPLLYQVYTAWAGKPANPEAEQGATMENMMGLMQWGMVMSFMLFFLTYTVDFFLASRDLNFSLMNLF